MSQTSYNMSPVAARAGLVASHNPYRSRSFVNYSTQQVLVTPTAANSTQYQTVVNGQTASFTSSGSATAANISTGLVAAINALTGAGVTAVDNGDGTYTLKANTQNTAFTFSFTGAGVQSSVTQIDGQEQIPFGLWVVAQPGVTPTGAYNPALATCRLPYQSSDITGGLAAGIALLSNVHISSTLPSGMPNNSGVPSYNQQDVLSAMVEGEVWVSPEVSVAVGDPAYVRFAPGAGGTQKGALRNSSDSSTAAQIPNGARFLDACSANGFSRLALMLP